MQDREKRLKEDRAAMPLDERQVKALEQIADMLVRLNTEMTQVRVQLANLNANSSQKR